MVPTARPPAETVDQVVALAQALLVVQWEAMELLVKVLTVVIQLLMEEPLEEVEPPQTVQIIALMTKEEQVVRDSPHRSQALLLREQVAVVAVVTTVEAPADQVAAAVGDEYPQVPQQRVAQQTLEVVVAALLLALVALVALV
jgi:hypothetical protein